MRVFLETQPEKCSLERTMLGHTRDVTAMAVSPALGLIASGSVDGMVRLWQVCAGNVCRRFV